MILFPAHPFPNFASLTEYFINILFSGIYKILYTFEKQNRNKSDKKHYFVPLPVSLAFFPIRYLHFYIWMKKRSFVLWA